MVVGESGTGKELLAHAIHLASPRSEGPFVAVNSGTLCGDVAVAELCGYEPGSFTGADRHTHVGLFDIAVGGTLFLDEIQDMPPTPQSVLLRFLETGKFLRVGGTQLVQSRPRVISASNVAPEDLEKRGLVRSDLLYRLNCMTIELQPLRERRDDIRPIAERCLREELHFLGEVEPDFWHALETAPYSWPGNARGVRNVLLKAILNSKEDRLSQTDLPNELWQQTPQRAEPKEAKGGDGQLGIDALRAVLGATHHNVSETARRLGIHRSTVYRRIARPTRDGDDE
jgi:transcriptional regulator with PAS, ATPase and Fis domain